MTRPDYRTWVRVRPEDGRIEPTLVTDPKRLGYLLKEPATPVERLNSMRCVDADGNNCVVVYCDWLTLG